MYYGNSSVVDLANPCTAFLLVQQMRISETLVVDDSNLHIGPAEHSAGEIQANLEPIGECSPMMLHVLAS